MKLKLPLRWRIFRLFNFILFLFYTFSVGAAIVFPGKDENNQTTIFSAILEAVCMLLIILNLVFNMSIIQRYYSNRPISRRTGNLFRFATIVHLISLIYLWALWIHYFITYTEPVNVPADSDEPTNIELIITLITLFLLPHLFILFKQFFLKRFIDRSHKERLNTMIESIGK